MQHPKVEVKIPKGWDRLAIAILSIAALWNQVHPTRRIIVYGILYNYSTMLVQYAGGPEWFKTVIESLCNESTQTCESCGELGNLISISTIETKVLCKDCEG